MKKKSENIWWKEPNGYIRGRVWEGKNKHFVLQHRYIVEKILGRSLEANEDVHHKDGNKTNNNPSNLEVLSHGNHSTITNYSYQHGKQKNSSSKFFGVWFYKKQSLWCARIKFQKKSYWCGGFKTEMEAAQAYDKKANEMGINKLNFKKEK